MSDSTYSFARLLSAWRKKALPEQFWLGGRLQLHEGRLVLTGHKCELDLPQEGLSAFRKDDICVLQLQLKALELVKEDSLLIRFKANQIVSSQLIQRNGMLFDAQVGLAHRVESWSFFLNKVRSYFTSQGLQEVQTPTLVQNPGMEPELEPFQASWRQGSLGIQLFLLTSPELHMKQLMVQGLSDIFEIKNVFRNEELTDLHEPEFTMIEWYRSFADLEIIKSDMRGLMEWLRPHYPAAQALGDVNIPEFTCAHFFRELLRFNLTPNTKREELLALATALNLKPNALWDWNDLYNLIWVAKIEPQLPRGLFFLTAYPPSQAALARLAPDGWAARMELYWDGVELANAFHELTDAREQRARFENDQKKRIEYGRTPLAIDENFMSALDMGLPPSAGIAMGLDRLFMKLTGAECIQDTRAFSVRHQLGARS